eukprot:gene24219-biopygen19403
MFSRPRLVALVFLWRPCVQGGCIERGTVEDCDRPYHSCRERVDVWCPCQYRGVRMSGFQLQCVEHATSLFLPTSRSGRGCHSKVAPMFDQLVCANRALGTTLRVARDSLWKARLLPDANRIICAPGAHAGCGPYHGAKTEFYGQRR